MLLPVVEEEPPEDLYPDEVLAQAEGVVEGGGADTQTNQGGGDGTLQEGAADASVTAAAPAPPESKGGEGTAADAAPASTQKQKAKTAPRRARAPAPPPGVDIADSPPEKTADEVVEDDVPDINALLRVCNHLWKNKDDKPMQPIDVARELGYGNTMDLYQAKQTPWQLFVTIRATRAPKGDEAASR